MITQLFNDGVELLNDYGLSSYAAFSLHNVREFWGVYNIRVQQTVEASSNHLHICLKIFEM